MIIYYVDAGPSRFFATLDEAKKAARDAATDERIEVNVDRCNIPATKERIVELANGITGNSDTVYTAKPRRVA